MENKQTVSPTLLAINILLVVLVAGMAFAVANSVKKNNDAKTAEVQSPRNTAFDDVIIQAKAAIVFDVARHRILFEKNAETQLPLASLTKLMMALVATDMLPEDSHITIRKEFLAEDGDQGLLDGESWKLKNLLDFSLVVSSNDGARALASVIGAKDLGTSNLEMGRKDFIGKMNSQAQSLGLSKMYFVNENGLDLGSVSGGYGSAKDVASLMAYILEHKPDILEATTYPVANISSLSKEHVAKNTNNIIADIPGLLASKTGYTTLAGGNLAVAFDAGMERPIIAVVLGSGQEGRFEDIQTLVNTSLSFIQKE